MFDLTYRDLDSPLHTAGIAPKVVLFGSLTILSLLYTDLLFLTSIIIILLLLAIAAGLATSVKAMLRFLLMFSAIVFAINLLANQHGDHPLLETSFRFYFWRLNFRVTLESLFAASRMVLRLVGVILSFLLFTLTTKPEKILARFTGIGGMEGIGLLLGLAYRFIPTLAADGAEIKDSLETRGVRFDEGGRFERIGSYASLGIPLLVNSLDRGLQLSEAMESRGYGSGRSWFKPPLLSSRKDAALLAYFCLAAGAYVLLYLLAGMGRQMLLPRLSAVPYAAVLLLLYTFPIAWRRFSDRI